MKRRTFITTGGAWLLLAIAATLLSVGDAHAQQAPLGYLEVYVNDTSTSKPVEGATVILRLDGQTISKNVTGSNGMLRYGPLTSSLFYQVLVFKKGYKFAKAYPVTVPDNYLLNKYYIPLKPR